MSPRGEHWLSMEEQRVSDRRELVRAARQAGGDWIAYLREWDLFGTLTYDPKRLDGTPSVHKARRDFAYWIVDVERVLRTPVAAVGAIEAMRSGWPHFHALLDVGGLFGHEIEVLGRLWFKRAGFGRIEVMRDYGPGFAARYCAKYMSKDAGSSDLIFTDALLHPDAPRWGRLD